MPQTSYTLLQDIRELTLSMAAGSADDRFLMTMGFAFGGLAATGALLGPIGFVLALIASGSEVVSGEG